LLAVFIGNSDLGSGAGEAITAGDLFPSTIHFWAAVADVIFAFA
jgi:hypothetical protein